MCGLAIEHDGETIHSIRGDDADPFSRGHLCPKALALKDVHEDPDRLRLPQRRRGDRWETLSWDEAFDEVAERLTGLQREHGPSAVGVFQGNPTIHNYGTMLFAQLFVRALRTRSHFSATSVDQLPQMLASLLMFGHQALLPVPDVDRSDYLLIVGANPLASNGSLMTAPGIERRLRDLRQRGGRIVVLDPRRTETAKLADEHRFVRPGRDALVLLAMVHVIVHERLGRLRHLAPFVDGLDAVERAAEGFSPEVVAPSAGIDADVIRRLAREFASADRAVCYGRVGACTQEFGGLVAWLVNVLNVLTGNLDRPGGAMFATPAVDLVKLAAWSGQEGNFARHRSRVRGLPVFGGELPAVALAEEIETPGEGQLRGLVVSAANPVLSTPNGVRLERALSTLEFMVSIDIYRNETSRLAHFILPPTFALEQSNYDVALHAVAVRDTARLSPALFAPPPSAQQDWEIYLELTRRIEATRGLRARLRGALTARAMRALGPRGLLGVLLKAAPKGRRVSLAELDAAPHGIDFGPLVPALPGRLYTANKRVDLAPAQILGDLPRLRAAMGRDDGALVLIGRRELRSNNSWMHNSERLVKGPERCTLLVHPDDAARLGVANGVRVRVSSRVGSVETTATLSDDVAVGVVSLPHGWGHGRPGVTLRVAQKRPGVSMNDLTDDAFIDALSGTACLNGTPVRVERIS